MKSKVLEEIRSLPYGVWTCADGREVLFNRGYRPIWQRRAGAATPADDGEWVAWDAQRWFYDGVTPSVGRRGPLRRRLRRVLDAFRCGEVV